jgi:NAD(P)H-hydrate epimerase
MGSSGEAGGFAVIASATATMGALKRGLVFSPGRELAGEVSIVDIGIPAKVIKEFNPYLWLVEPQDIFGRLPVRREDTHKGECGRVFILAGSPGLTGAACMSAEACVKSGAGLVVLGIPQSSNQIIEIKLTEAMSQPLAENASGSLSLKAEAEIKERLKWATACAIGPGLSRNPETLELIRSIISSLEIPSVIDADALFALAEKPESLEKLPKKTILTPHLGEFARLLGKSAEEIKLERVELVREKARAWRTVIVLKGSPTLIASPEGTVFVNSSGNSGMATGGVGDVLTGVLSALLGAGLEPVDAAVAGVYIHGLAGDLAMEEEGIFGLSATDLLKELPSAFKEFSC